LEGSNHSKSKIRFFRKKVAAIKFSKEKLPQNHKFKFYLQNIIKLALKDRVTELLGQQDFIYSSGLFDYLAIKAARKVGSALWNAVKLKGVFLWKEISRCVQP